MNNSYSLLTQTAFGRILLHLACAMRRPSHWNWHWQGVQREISFGLRFNGGYSARFNETLRKGR